MNSDALIHPTIDTWGAAIHSSEHDHKPIGTAVLVDVDRVLTCTHVMLSGGIVQDPL